MSTRQSVKVLRAEMAELQVRLSEAEETLNAIRSGAVDALVVQGPDGEQVFTLNGADQTYRALVEAMNEGAVTLSAEGVIVYCNERFAQTLQVPLEKVLGKSFFDLVRDGWKERWYQFLNVSRDRGCTGEISLNGSAGEVFVHLSSNPFSLDCKQGISLVVTDITLRKASEEALRKSEERFQHVARLTSDAIWEWDMQSDYIWRSEGFFKLMKHGPEANSFAWWEKSVHPEDREAVLRAVRIFLEKPGSYYSHTYRFRRGDGTYADIFDRAVVLFDERNRPVRMIGAMTDITEQKKAEAIKRELSKNVLTAQERERQRVARELHDGVNQLLSSSKYRLHAVFEQISKTDKPLADKVDAAKSLIEKAIAEVRLISRNLRPSELDDLGLAAAIRSFAHEFQERTGVCVSVKIPPEEKALPESVELTIYRIIQEALNNVEKHAEATRVQVKLSYHVTFVQLLIVDDGLGFDPEKVRRSRQSGWGLENMRERASYVGGAVTVKSAPRTGTEILVSIATT